MAVRRVVLGRAAAPRRGARGRVSRHVHAHELEVRGGRTVDSSESWVDPLIGSRIGLELTDRWAIVGEGNLGGFGVGTDFTWNAQAYVGYQFSLFGRPTTLLFGYRALSQDYDHNDFERDVTMHGR